MQVVTDGTHGASEPASTTPEPPLPFTPEPPLPDPDPPLAEPPLAEPPDPDGVPPEPPPGCCLTPAQASQQERAERGQERTSGAERRTHPGKWVSGRCAGRLAPAFHGRFSVPGRVDGGADLDRPGDGSAREPTDAGPPPGAGSSSAIG